METKTGFRLATKEEIERIDFIAFWQSIDTAPKDGRRIIGYGLIGLESEMGIGTVRWHDFYKQWEADPCEASEYSPEPCKLSHWMPLPEPPK